MAYTYDTWLADYPEFAEVPPAAVARQLRQSLLMLNPAAWGKWYETAQGDWTAHHVALEYNIAGKCAELGMRSPYDVGVMHTQTASTNSLTVGYTPPALATGDDPIAAGFARTSYGLRYLQLLHTVVPAGGVVFSPDTSAAMQR